VILIADDDPIYTRGLVEIFNESGYDEVTAVPTGEQVLSFMEKRSAPDVLILDMMIPWTDNDWNGARPPADAKDLRGFQVIRGLSERGFDTSRILVITAYYVAEITDLLRARGVKYVLFKPAFVSDILRAVRSIFPPRQAQR
jgi:CheY-like chemotaxis protein